MNPFKNLLASFLAAAAIALAAAAPASALDRITLKNGKVIEGEITKEGDGFVFIDIVIGTMKRNEIVTTDQIAKVERDVDAKPDTTAATTATPLKPKDKEPEQPKPADPAPPPAEEKPAAETPISDSATRVCFISLEEMVGPYLNADALKHSVELVKDEKPEIIVLVINSGGGALAEVEPLSDYIHEEMKKDYRVVTWIQSAISAASLTAFNCEEIYMMKEGNLGGTVAFSMTGNSAKAASGADLELILRAGEGISKRGKRNPLIMRAMQILMELSADIDENGNVTWYEGSQGKYLVNPEDRILTFNSENAKKFGVSKGTADTKDELLHVMGVKEWTEVGPKADEYQIEFRANVAKFEALAGKIIAEYNLALSAAGGGGGGDQKTRNMYIGRARTKLLELQSAVRRAPSYEKYGPYKKEWFEEELERLRKMTKPAA